MDLCTPHLRGVSDIRSRAEKTDFLLEQVRLCIAANDWITAENNSRKISTRWFDSADEEDKSEEKPPYVVIYKKVELKLRYPLFNFFSNVDITIR